MNQQKWGTLKWEKHKILCSSTKSKGNEKLKIFMLLKE